MKDLLLDTPCDPSIAVIPLTTDTLPAWQENAPIEAATWVKSTGFSARPGERCLIPDRDHRLDCVLVGIEADDDPWCLAHLPDLLPDDTPCHLDNRWTTSAIEAGALGWALAAYRFDRYRKNESPSATLFPGSAEIAMRARKKAQAVARVRDLINTPACDMMPRDLADTTLEIARRHGADLRIIAGDELLEKGYPAIHAVGRASAHAPLLIDLRWGDENAPLVVLVGKGVCFDSGGLDIKNAAGMRLMKKDMGGAAHAIALAELIMQSSLDLRLRVLIPAVENAISGNAFRPGDILATRKGLSIEVDNTDAEGRVVLSDALHEGASEKPDLMIDFATLTGAARIALGYELPAMFTDDDDIAHGIEAAGRKVHDPVWRMPLHAPYRRLIRSRIADIANATSKAPGGGAGGAITAALFLQAFVPDGIPWVHFDIMAWMSRARPGRPEGGEAMTLRAVFEFLEGWQKR
ncbi:leucyl aminopeptidase family protein [Thioalkalivibrio sp. HK1]|uniref:leucyl aminopeptidase family protein n=1 Tax=Thioalkalivibrio sp. HK1 TaxID=1469245 RepID=UPI0004722A71|nr:leucyl aminopeptidase family protein [Thioalkalivibrio sp. HK1]